MTERNDVESKRLKQSARCDIFHTEDRVMLKLEMPGVLKEDLDVRVDNDLLIISGKRTQSPIQGKYLIREMRTGDYHQEFTLDDTIDRDAIDASIKNGVVTLVLSIKESVKPRKIKINVG